LLLTVLTAMMLLDVADIQLAPGETHLKRPLEIPKSSLHIMIRGDPAGSTLVLDAAFKGSAAILVDAALDVSLSGFQIRGNRTSLKSDWYLPPVETAFADFYTDNGIVIRHSSHVTVRDVSFQSIRAFPVLINSSSEVTLDGIKIENSGTLNSAGRNNTTGGILLEEGVSKFEVRRSTINRITGTAIWTHSYGRSLRQSDGVIRDNEIGTVGRDAIQIGHATRIRVENNSGSALGFPADYVDVESQGFAVAIDTAGNVDHATYTNNRFTDVNGECIDLDGFHDGEVTDNSCINRKPSEAYPASHYGIAFGNNAPGVDSAGITITGNVLEGFAFGALFLAGSHNRIENNRFLDVNRTHCGTTPVNARCNYALDQPDLLRSGIYLSNNGGRVTETKDNTIRSNVISGFGMKDHCIAAGPGVLLSDNTISGNTCSDLPQ
jgi:hypothetical protein